MKAKGVILGLAATASETIAAGRAPEFPSAVARLRSLTDRDLEAVNREILGRLDSPVKMIPELAGHLIGAGGKRLRPMLTLASAKLFGYEGEDHVKLAAAVELIHGATLLHDDVVDASALRRGASTANIIWGNKESVLVGDFIFSRSFELMVEAKNLAVLKSLSHASSVIAQGEVLQLTTQKNIAASFETYLQVVRAKNFEDAVALPSQHQYGNGVAIFTRNGAAAREFAAKVNVGMVGVNVPIPVPVAYHTFGGWKRSGFGDTNQHGPEGVKFWTKIKTITQRWPEDVQGSEFVIPTME